MAKLGLNPKASECRYFFGVFPEPQLMGLAGYLQYIVAIVRENEGITAVFEEAAKEPMQAYSERGFKGPFALITLAAATDLHAVGITAAVSGALAKEKIPANIFAGYHHDHLLVPYEMRGKAVLAIEKL